MQLDIQASTSAASLNGDPAAPGSNGVRKIENNVTAGPDKGANGTATISVGRRLGETELSYYLPSRENGVNDMYLHLGFRAPANLVARSRVRIIWAIIRQRHPLLAASIRMNDYDDVRFKYQAIASVDLAISSADAHLEYREQNKDGKRLVVHHPALASVNPTFIDLIDSYLNGPRTLSNDRLSYLYISSPDTSSESSTDELEFNWMICTTHYIGDGMALHQTANDFFTLLGSKKNEAELQALLNSEMTSNRQEGEQQLPLSIEDRLPESRPERIYGAISTVDHLLSQRKLIGGHAFPRRSGQPRRTVVPTVSFDPEKTKQMLKKCKENGVSISSVVFALCNIAWAKTHTRDGEYPMMMYSALNLRPYLRANENLKSSYWFLAIGYFNVVLPSFLPREGPGEAAIFWHRARSVKLQTSKAAKSPMLASRSQAMAKERGLRSRIWGMQDDGVECKLSMPNPKLFENDTPAPSKALIGLSLLGNLDGTYKHQSFSPVTLHTLTTGSRQRQGGMLLFGYTFVGKLWLSLGYDVNGFDDEVVQRFWKHLLSSADEFLCN
ncbi:hypothetical protein CC2G_000639 [Coprinopsis cinerea AmutBmut pab1-1]|nr:hypothetical protein CC2G_000639 [Coprinopsis cinerea AmutBmut pab1-1]